MRGAYLLLLLGCSPVGQQGLPTDTGQLSPPGGGGGLLSDCDWAGYQEILDADLEAAELRAALSEATAFADCHYSSTTTYLFLELDNDGGEVTCVYTGRTTEAVDAKPDHETDMNTEHLWPQSLGAGVPPMRCDLHHLRTSDVEANLVRANHPFGHVVGAASWEQGGSRLGFDHLGRQVFEPRAGERGPIARSMLYFAVRYGHEIPAEQAEIYLDWHLQEPPSDWEVDRSYVIAERQGHANPFVVCEEAAALAFP